MSSAFYLAVVVLGGLGRAPADSSIVAVQREAWTMGTRFRLVVEAASDAEARGATEAALREVEGMERLLSSWDPSSELSRVNVAPVGRPVGVSSTLEGILSKAIAWSDSTDGAFSPAIGALVDAWGLRAEGRTPSATEVAEALGATGRDALELRAGRAVRHASRAWIDAGGFGKGAGLAAAAARLEELGVQRALLDLGGQLWAAAPPEAPWTVLVAHPDRRFDPVARLSVAGVSVASSGLSERPGHLLDPRTGLRAPDWGSVTVVHADPMIADVLATALYVMGPSQGLRWAREHHVPALFLDTRSGRLLASWTPALAPWLLEAPEGAVSRSLSMHFQEPKGTYP